MLKAQNEQTLYLPYHLPGLNEIIAASKAGRGKYNEYSRMKKEWTNRVVLAIQEQEIQPVKRALFRFIWCEENKRHNPDNIAAGGRKFILDALVETEVLKNDGWKEIAGWEDVFCIREDSCVYVIIKETEEQL